MRWLPLVLLLLGCGARRDPGLQAEEQSSQRVTEVAVEHPGVAGLVLARFEVSGDSVARGSGSPGGSALQVAVVHADAAVAGTVLAALLSRGPDAAPVQSAGAWAVVATDDGTVYRLGAQPGNIEELAP